MTVDEHAMRLWSSDKHVKSLHRKIKTRGISLEYIKKISCFLYIYVDQSTKKTMYELWDTNLTMLQQVHRNTTLRFAMYNIARKHLIS